MVNSHTMRIAKRIIIAFLLFIALVVLALTGAYLLVDNATMVAMVTKQLAGASNTHITYRQDAAITRTLSPTLSINELLIQDDKENFQVSINTLEMQITLSGLLSGKLDIARLAIGDTHLEIKANGRSDRSSKLSLPESLPLKPVLHDFSISQISIDSGDGKYAMPPINISELTLSPDLMDEKFVCTVQTEFGGQKILFNLEIPEIHKIIQSRMVPFSIVAKGATIDLSVNGEIDFNPPTPTVEATVQGKGSDLQHISIGTNDIDLMGEFTVQSIVKGTVEKLAMEDLSVVWKAPGASSATLSGRIADIIGLTGLDLKVDGKFDKPTWLNPLLPGSIGVINTAELSARIEGGAQKLAIRTFAMSLNTDDGLDLSLDGQLDLVHKPSGMNATAIDLHLVFAAPTTHAARGLLFEQVWELGAITGKADIRSSGDGNTALENVVVQARKENGIEVDLNGGIAHLPLAEGTSISGYDFTVNMKAPTTSLMGETLGINLPLEGPLDVSFKITGDVEALQFNAIKLAAGKTRFDADINWFINSMPPRISGRITAQEFFLPDLLEEKTESSVDKRPDKDSVFSREPMDWNWLKKADLDLAVAIESFDKEKSQIESAQFTVDLKSGNLTISQAELFYPKGKLEFDVKLDVQDQPQVSLKVFGKDINPWLAMDMQQAKTKDEFDAELDIDMELMSSGASAHELASNLTGAVYVIINNGRIQKKLLNLLFVDIVGWTLDKATGAKYTEVKCGVADYSIKEGLISTNGLFLDTTGIVIAGEGSIDLGKEQIDYVLLPRKKSKLIFKADPVNVTGPLNNPSVKTIPLKTAVKNYGTLFFSPYLFAGIAAADFLSDTLKLKGSKSACTEYEEKHRQVQDTSGNKQNLNHSP